MGKSWRIILIMTLLLLMAFALMGSNNIMLANPEKGTFMYALKNVDMYVKEIFKAVMHYLENL